MRVNVVRFLAGLTLALLSLGVRSSGAQDPFPGIGHDRGADKAKTTIIEFADFGCGYCAKFAVETYPRLDSSYVATGRARWKFIPFVTGNFRNAREAAEAAECASDQNAFWKMHDVLFARRKDWMASTKPNVTLLRYAKELGLDLAKFTKCASDPGTHTRVLHNDMLANTLAVRGTPTFYVNGRAIVGAVPFDLFRQILDGGLR